MGVKLQKYERKVGAQPGFGGTPGSLETAGAPFAAMGRAADAVGKISGGMADYALMIQKHKNEGDIAGYENDKKAFKANLVNVKREARLSGVKDDQIMDTVVVPAMDGFISDQRERGYSENVQGFIDNDWSYAEESIFTEEQGEILQGTIVRSNLQKVELATELGASGDKQGADELWDDLQATMKPEAWQSARSMAVMKPAQIEIQELERQALAGEIEPEEYFKGLGSIKDRVKSSEHTIFAHKHMIELQTNSKQNALIKTKMRNAEQESDYFNAKITKDIAEASDYVKLREAMGDNWADGVEVATETGELMKVVSDIDSKKAMRNLQSLYNGELSITQFVRENSKIGGVVGATTLLAGSDMLKELSATQGEFTSYEFWYKDRSVKLDTNTANFMNRIGVYLDDTPGDVSEYINTSISSLQKWKKEKPEATKEEYDEFAAQYFKPLAINKISALSAPQVGQSEQDFDKMTDEELEAYINE